MCDLPGGPALLALARDVLLNDLMPRLPEERRLDALLVANSMAIAERECKAGDATSRAIFEELDMLYRPLTPSLSPHCGERDGPAKREGEGLSWASRLTGLLRHFAGDLRVGAFASSAPRDRDARAVLWRLTIAKLRQANPRFLAANGFG
jgi:hypothetical protein